MFVRPHHKKQFKQLCQDLTGAGCPEDSEGLLLPAQECGFVGRGGSGSTTEESEIQGEAASPTPGTSKDGLQGRVQSTILSCRSRASNLKSNEREAEHPRSTSDRSLLCADPLLGSSKTEVLKKSQSTACPTVHSESQKAETDGGSCRARQPTNSNIPPVSPVNSRAASLPSTSGLLKFLLPPCGSLLYK
uniref:Uncharacterized protein n=1 Tax=Sphaerodactylus townsendi TaxID=933632 RepID=A0ACB8F7N6_9SAUR